MISRRINSLTQRAKSLAGNALASFPEGKEVRHVDHGPDISG
jgi:hypothetical protein